MFILHGEIREISKPDHFPIFQFPNGFLFNNDFHICFFGGDAPAFTISMKPLVLSPSLLEEIGPEKSCVSVNFITSGVFFFILSP